MPPLAPLATTTDEEGEPLPVIVTEPPFPILSPGTITTFGGAGIDGRIIEGGGNASHHVGDAIP